MEKKREDYIGYKGCNNDDKVDRGGGCQLMVPYWVPSQRSLHNEQIHMTSVCYIGISFFSLESL